MDIMKDPLKVDDPIITKVDRYRMRAITFIKIIIGVEV
jgi:hypothetical protein